MNNNEKSVEESLLVTACEVLSKVAEILPKHDRIIQRLEPRFDDLTARLNEMQSEHRKQVDRAIERGFRKMEDSINPLLNDREILLNALCRAHSDSLDLSKGDSKKAAAKRNAKTEAMVASLEKTLSDFGVEIVSVKGRPWEDMSMRAQGYKEDPSVPNGTAIEELSPGYRVKCNEGYRYLIKAQVVLSRKPASDSKS